MRRKNYLVTFLGSHIFFLALLTGRGLKKYLAYA